MNLIFFVEARYIKNKSGVIYNTQGVLKFPLWDRYLAVFNSLTVVARVKYIPDYIGKDEHIANNERVRFYALPYFFGPKQYILKKKKVVNAIKSALGLEGVVLLRVPGQIGTLAAKVMTKRNISYGVEVVGDPFDVFSKGAVNHPLRLYFKYKYFYDLTRIVENASSVLYVTKKTLQARYVNKVGAPLYSASNVALQPGNIAKTPKNLISSKLFYKIITIGSLEQMYKAPDILLKSVKILKDQGCRVKLTWIGAGKHLDEMENLAKRLNITGEVEFVGYISNKAKIISFLDDADIFVLASRTEGLPRVIIEAMSRALPVVGTRVGGIPELVSEKFLVKKDDPNAIAEKIKLLINDPIVYSEESKENLRISTDYTEDKLSKVRGEFYHSMIDFMSEKC